jgi:signal transduction histidine kinase
MEYVAALSIISCLIAIAFALTFREKLRIANEQVRILAAGDVQARDKAARLNQTDQLRKEFLQMIGHDVRTPLMSLQSVLKMLSKGTYGEVDERGKERLHQAEESLAYVVALINQLFEVEKLANEELLLKYERTDLLSTCEKALEIAKPFGAYKNVDLVLDCPSVEVEADHGRLSQVILNLVSNAIKHSPEESTIRVSVETTVDSVHIRIVDEGPGLQRELRDKAFERYVQFSDEGDGMGLGLAISKAIIGAHEGDIGVESHFGRGCAFWFRIPLTKPDRQVVAKAQST